MPWPRLVPDRNRVMDPSGSRATVRSTSRSSPGAGSELCLRFRGILFDQWTGTGAVSIKFDKEHRDFMREHRELMEAVLQRDADAATYLGNRHITMSTRVLLAADPSLFVTRCIIFEKVVRIRTRSCLRFQPNLLRYARKPRASAGGTGARSCRSRLRSERSTEDRS